MPLSEDQLCDWIDGHLTTEHVQRLLAASGRTDLPQRIAQMQRQKLALRALPIERAPRDLHDRTLAALEREMLLGVAEAERTSETSPPVLTLVRDDENARTRRRNVAARTWLPRFAMAAGIALVAGGVSYFVLQAVRMGTRPMAPTTIASSDTSASDPSRTAPSTSTAARSPEVLAAATDRASADRVAASTTSSQSASGESEVAARDSADARLPIVTLDRAAVLASEGRLAIRVVSDDLAGLKSFELVGTTGPQRGWKLRKDVPAQVIASVVPIAYPHGSDRPLSDDPRWVASEVLAPMAGPGAAFSAGLATSFAGAHSGPISKVRASYLVSVPSNESGLDVLRTTLRTRLKGAVEFLELPQALSLPSADTAREALWWTQATSQWTPRASVPLLVARP